MKRPQRTGIAECLDYTGEGRAGGSPDPGLEKFRG